MALTKKETSHWTHRGHFGKYEIYYNRGKKILTIRTPDGRRVRYTKATEPSKAYAQAIQDIEGWEAAEKHNIEELGAPYHVGRKRNPSRRSPAGRTPVHTAAWDRCVKDVKRKGTAVSPYAVCSAMLGEKGSVKAGHRRKNPTRQRYQIFIGETPSTMHYFGTKSSYSEAMNAAREYQIEHPYVRTEVRMHPDDKPKRQGNPSGFQLEKTQRLYFVVHAHPHKGSGERLWLTQAGHLSRDKAKAARYTSVDVAVARAKAHLKRYPDSRKYRFDVCVSD